MSEFFDQLDTKNGSFQKALRKTATSLRNFPFDMNGNELLEIECGCLAKSAEGGSDQEVEK